MVKLPTYEETDLKEKISQLVCGKMLDSCCFIWWNEIGSLLAVGLSDMAKKLCLCIFQQNGVCVCVCECVYTEL